MARFKDFSNYKNNRLKYYFFQKALENYAARKKNDDNMPKVNNLIFTTFFTFLVTESCWMTTLRDNNLTLYWSLVFLFYIAGMVFYYLFIIPMYKLFINAYNNIKFQLTTNPDKFLTKDQRTKKGFLNRFNHDVSDQIAHAIDITSHINEERSSTENQFYTIEAFKYTKYATENLYELFFSPDFIKEQKGNYSLIKKYRFSTVIPLIEKLTDQVVSNLETLPKQEDLEQDLKDHSRNLRILKENIMTQ